jgi:hypothetical protein
MGNFELGDGFGGIWWYLVGFVFRMGMVELGGNCPLLCKRLMELGEIYFLGEISV